MALKKVTRRPFHPVAVAKMIEAKTARAAERQAVKAAKAKGKGKAK